MCSRTQYKHNVRAAAQCVEVSWTSAFLLPRALTDVLFLLFVPSALRGVQHVTICTFQFCKSVLSCTCCFHQAGTCPLVLGPKNWDGLGSAGGGLPSGEAQFERHRFLTGFWVPKMVPKILQANLIFYVVFATLASQTVLAEKLKVFKKALGRPSLKGTVF